MEQGWEHYFNMLNGPIYSNLVYDFWRKSEVITLVDANVELQRVIDQNPMENKGKSRVELGSEKIHRDRDTFKYWWISSCINKKQFGQNDGSPQLWNCQTLHCSIWEKVSVSQ